MKCIISFRRNQSVLFVVSPFVNEDGAEETAGADTLLLIRIIMGLL